MFNKTFDISEVENLINLCSVFLANSRFLFCPPSPLKILPFTVKSPAVFPGVKRFGLVLSSLGWH